MAEVTLTIGGRHYDVHCGNGEEMHLFRLAEMVDAKTALARKATPGLTEIRQLLFAAILLADDLSDLRAQSRSQGSLDLDPTRGGPDDDAVTSRIEMLTARIEAIAGKLAGTDAAP